jgi:hypothetical protein
MNIQICIRSILVRKGLATVLAIGLFIGLTACGPKHATDISVDIQGQNTAIPTANVNPSSTNETSLPMPTQLSVINSACWPMQNVGHRSLSGSLLYYYINMDPDRAIAAAGGPAMFDLKTGQSKGLKNFLPRDISPDGKMLTELTSSNWIFLAENKNLSYPIPDVTLTKESTYMFLPNGQMLWEGPSSDQKKNLGNEATRDLYVFSPDTGELIFVQTVLLPYSLWKISTPGNDYRAGLYSPDLKYVLYPANYEGTNLSILLNIQSQDIVWYGWPDSDLGFYRSPLPYFTIETPVWRSDSNGVILHQKDEKTGIQNLYNLSIDGQISQLTHLEELFPANKYTISSLSISPNGQYLAFAVVQDSQIFPTRNSLLLILDLKNGTLINPCITLANSPSYPGRPVWSPDSSAIAIFPDAGNVIVAVDLDEKELFSIFPKTGLDAGSLLGWISWEIP